MPTDDGAHQLKLDKAIPSPPPARGNGQDTDEEGEEDEGDDEAGAEGDFLAEFPDETDVSILLVILSPFLTLDLVCD